MADNVTIPATGSGTATPVVATDDVGGIHYQRVKPVGGADGVATRLDVAEDEASAGGDLGIVAMARRTDTPANQSGTDGDWEPLQVSAGLLWVRPLGKMVTVTTTITRAANVTAYTAGDNVGSTDTGGYTFTGCARVSGGSGIITDAIIEWNDETTTKLQGEIQLYDTAFTAVADNASFVVSDAEAITCVGVIPFTLFDNGNQDIAHVQNLSIGFTTVGSANLRFAVVARNGPTPIANSSTLTIRLKILQVD